MAMEDWMKQLLKDYEPENSPKDTDVSTPRKSDSPKMESWVQQAFNGVEPANAPAKSTNGEQSLPKENERGLVDYILDSLGITGIALRENYKLGKYALTGDDSDLNEGSPVLPFIGGTIAEVVERGFNPEGTLAAKYDPSVAAISKAISEKAGEFGDKALDVGSKRLTVDDYDTFSGALMNSTGSGFYGSLGGLADFIGDRKSANALNNAAAALYNRDRVSTDDGYGNYFSNPRGLTSDFGQLFGSQAAIMPIGFTPTGVVGRFFGEIAAKAGGSALVNYLIKNGAYRTAKFAASEVPKLASYGAKSGAVESMMEGGGVLREALDAGYSPEEARAIANRAALYNLPLLMGTNTLEAIGMFSPLGKFSKLGRLSKPAQIAGRMAMNSGQEQSEEAMQRGIEDAVMGREYGIAPWNWTEAQRDAAEAVRYPAAIWGGLGSAFQAIRGNDDQGNWIEGDSSNVTPEGARQRADYAATKNSFEKLRSYAEKTTGGRMKPEVFDAIMRESVSQGVDPRLALSIAIAESKGDQEEVSPVGAVGVMQLMPETAKWLGVNEHDMEQNVHGGVKYIKYLLNHRATNGDTTLAIAAYNAGEGNVEDYGGIPPFAETQQYVERVNGYRNDVADIQADMPTFYSNDGRETLGGKNRPAKGIVYLGENGGGEGKYWARNPGMNASLEGAQPGLATALDLLGKWYYDRTGKKLWLNAGTDGNHADGTYSHSKGYKIDVVDEYVAGEDSPLITADFHKGKLADEFIAYGRSLGLGMNFEGAGANNVHFDISLAGEQWDGNGENAGGFSLDRVRAAAKSGRGWSYSPPGQGESDTSSTGTESEETPQTPKVEPVDIPEAPKPLFDLNAEDDKTKDIIGRFAEQRRDAAEGTEELDFFEGMFDRGGNFRNTKANRDVIRQEFADDLTDFGNNWLAQEQEQATPQPQKPSPKATPQAQPIVQGQQQGQSTTQGQPVTAQPTQGQPVVSTQPQGQPTQGQPFQPSQDTVSQNGTPENVLTPPSLQGQFQASTPAKRIGGVQGTQTQVSTDNNKSFAAQYKVVEADDLKFSIPNDFVSEDKARYIGEALDSKSLLQSGNANQGAPVIQSDGTVLNGAKRVRALYYAHNKKDTTPWRVRRKGRLSPKQAWWAAYGSYLENEAEALGLNKDEIAQMQKPVLVREVTKDLSDDDLQSIANSKGVLGNETSQATQTPATGQSQGTQENPVQNPEPQQTQEQVKNYSQNENAQPLFRNLKVGQYDNLGQYALDLLKRAQSSNETTKKAAHDEIQRISSTKYTDEELAAWNNRLAAQGTSVQSQPDATTSEQPSIDNQPPTQPTQEQPTQSPEEEPQGVPQAPEKPKNYAGNEKVQQLRDKVRPYPNQARRVEELLEQANDKGADEATRQHARTKLDEIADYTKWQLEAAEQRLAAQSQKQPSTQPTQEQPQATPDAESTDANSRTFRRNGTDASEIIEGRKAIKDAPDGTTIKTKWASGEERTHVVSRPPEGRPTFQERGGNGELIGKPYVLNIENIGEVFGGSNLQEIQLIYPENDESSTEAISNSDDEQDLKSPAPSYEQQLLEASAEVQLLLELRGDVEAAQRIEDALNYDDFDEVERIFIEKGFPLPKTENHPNGEPQSTPETQLESTASEPTNAEETPESTPVEATPETEPTGDVEGEEQLPSKRRYRKGVAGKFKKRYPEGTIGYKLQQRIKPDTHPYLSEHVDALIDRVKHDDAAKAELKDILSSSDEELARREQALKAQRADSENQTNVASPTVEETSNKQPESSSVEQTQGETTSGEQSDTQGQPSTQGQAQSTPAKKIDGVEGNTATVKADNRRKFKVRYKVVEADDLNVSHGFDDRVGAYVNPDYPQEFQPRDRTGAAYNESVLKMSSELDPEQLMQSDNLNQGAPLIRNDGVVLNGNGRSMAIRRAYEIGQGDKYRDALIEAAYDYGLDEDEIARMKKPVLVREINQELSPDDLKSITESTLGGMRNSAVDQAKLDAQNIPDSVLARAPQDGDLTKANAYFFLKAVLDAIVPPGSPDRATVITKNEHGLETITNDGLNRVRRAIFFAAFGEGKTLAKIAETSQLEGDSVKGATNAMIATAPKFANIQAQMKKGDIPNTDLSFIVKAVEKLKALRDTGESVFRHLTAQSFAGMDNESEEMKDLLAFFETHKRKPAEITRFMNAIADGFLARSSGGTVDMFGIQNQPISLRQIIADARQEVEGDDITREMLNEPTLYSAIAKQVHKGLQTHKDKTMKAAANSLLNRAKNGDDWALQVLNRFKGTATNELNSQEQPESTPKVQESTPEERHTEESETPESQAAEQPASQETSEETSQDENPAETKDAEETRLLVPVVSDGNRNPAAVVNSSEFPSGQLPEKARERLKALAKKHNFTGTMKADEASGFNGIAGFEFANEQDRDAFIRDVSDDGVLEKTSQYQKERHSESTPSEPLNEADEEKTDTTERHEDERKAPPDIPAEVSGEPEQWQRSVKPPNPKRDRILGAKRFKGLGKRYPHGSIGWKLQQRLNEDKYPYLLQHVDDLLERAKTDEDARTELRSILSAPDEVLNEMEQNLAPQDETQTETREETSTEEGKAKESETTEREWTDEDIAVMNTTPENLQANEQLEAKLQEKFPAIKAAISALIKVANEARQMNRTINVGIMKAREDLVLLLRAAQFNDGVANATAENQRLWATNELSYVWDVLKSTSKAAKTQRLKDEAKALIKQFNSKEISADELYRKTGELLFPEEFSKAESYNEQQPTSQAEPPSESREETTSEERQTEESETPLQKSGKAASTAEQPASQETSEESSKPEDESREEMPKQQPQSDEERRDEQPESEQQSEEDLSPEHFEEFFTRQGKTVTLTGNPLEGKVPFSALLEQLEKIARDFDGALTRIVGAIREFTFNATTDYVDETVQDSYQMQGEERQKSYKIVQKPITVSTAVQNAKDFLSYTTGYLSDIATGQKPLPQEKPKEQPKAKPQEEERITSPYFVVVEKDGKYFVALKNKPFLSRVPKNTLTAKLDGIALAKAKDTNSVRGGGGTAYTLKNGERAYSFNSKQDLRGFLTDATKYYLEPIEKGALTLPSSKADVEAKTQLDEQTEAALKSELEKASKADAEERAKAKAKAEAEAKAEAKAKAEAVPETKEEVQAFYERNKAQLDEETQTKSEKVLNFLRSGSITVDEAFDKLNRLMGRHELEYRAFSVIPTETTEETFVVFNLRNSPLNTSKRDIKPEDLEQLLTDIAYQYGGVFVPDESNGEYWYFAFDGEKRDDNADNFQAKAKMILEKAAETDEIKTIDDCLTFKELKTYFKERHNATIDDDVQWLDFNGVKEFLTGVEKTFAEFSPRFAGRIHHITTAELEYFEKPIEEGIERDITYAQINYLSNNKRKDVKIALNRTAFSQDNIQKTRESVTIGSSLVSTTIEGLGAHEAAHAIHILLMTKMGFRSWQSVKNKKGEVVNNALNEFASEFIRLVCGSDPALKKAFPQAGDKKNGLATRKKWKAEISKYATTSDTECIAEAVADVREHGEDAKPLSKAIFAAMKEATNEEAFMSRAGHVNNKTWRYQLILNQNFRKNGIPFWFRSALSTPTVLAWHVRDLERIDDETKKKPTEQREEERKKRRHDSLLVAEQLLADGGLAKEFQETREDFAAYDEEDTDYYAFSDELDEIIKSERPDNDKTVARKIATNVDISEDEHEDDAESKYYYEVDDLIVRSLKKHSPDERIMAKPGGWTDEKIREALKIVNVKNAIAGLNVRIHEKEDGSLTFYNVLIERGNNNYKRAKELAEDIKSDDTIRKRVVNCLEELETPDLSLSADESKGAVDTTIRETPRLKELSPFYRALNDFAEMLGVPVVFFRGDPNFHGKHSRGITFINIDAKLSASFIFWHEFGHWLKNNQPALYKAVADSIDITQEQIDEKRKSRRTLTDEELRDEIIFDAFRNAAQREGLFKLIGKKDKNLLERFVSWAKAVLDRFTDWFRKPDRGLTTAQANQMQGAFGKMVRSLTDSKGNKIFRVNNQTHVIEHIDGRTLKTWNLDAKAGYSFAGEKAKTAQTKHMKASLGKAIQMEKDGASRQEIFDATGWFKGKDGKWRFEIVDDFRNIYFTALDKRKKATLGEIYHNAALYKAYPLFSKMTVRVYSQADFENDDIKTAMGYYSPARKEIVLNPKYWYAWKEVLVHELQHAIQDIEGFASGGTGKYARKILVTRGEDISGLSDHDLWFRLGGEQEAMEVSERAKARRQAKMKALSNPDRVKAIRELEKIKSEQSPEIQRLADEYEREIRSKGFTDSARQRKLEKKLPDELREAIIDVHFAYELARSDWESGDNVPTVHGEKVLLIYDGKTTSLSFAGEKAKTADIARLDKAKQMEAEGKSRDEIYKATGWFKGKDNKWRFEIPDHRSKMNLSVMENGKYVSLNEVYDNPSLFAAYPFLKKIRVALKESWFFADEFGEGGEETYGTIYPDSFGRPPYIYLGVVGKFR